MPIILKFLLCIYSGLSEDCNQQRPRHWDHPWFCIR